MVDLTDGLSVISAWYAEVEPGSKGRVRRRRPPPQVAVVPHLRGGDTGTGRQAARGAAGPAEVISLLQTRQQIVFYGPPGTGKTLPSRKDSPVPCGEEQADHVKTVQFHPSYAYEDFFEGYRPAKTKEKTSGSA